MSASAYEFSWLRASNARRGLPPLIVVPVCLLMIGAIAAGAYLSAYQIRFSVLYLGPIALATWIAGWRAGVVITVISSASWMITFWSGRPHLPPFYFLCEGGLTLAMFLIFVALIARLRQALDNSDARLLTVLEGLDAAVHVEDARTGASLYHNGRFAQLFGARRFSQETGEMYDTANASWYLIQSRIVKWTDGRDAVLRMLSDVTEEHAAHEFSARQREVAHRTSRMVALGGLASGIAHELNQPLTAISTYNEACLRLLQDGSCSTGELRDAMQKCRDQAQRAGAIIHRLREILRQPVRPMANLELAEVAASVRKLVAHEAAEADVLLELDLANGLPRVSTDQVLIEQVVLNFVRNAIEAVRDLPDDRRRVTIATCLDNGGNAVLSVSDPGPGLPGAVAERLFEAFVTTKPGGLGLGLSICRSVVESLGGTIGHDRDATRGTRFWFTLPAGNA